MLGTLGPPDATIVPELLKIVLNRGLEYAEEVTPHLDLRGYDNDIPARGLDLSGVRFDFATLRKSFSETICRKCVFDGADAPGISFGTDFCGASFVAAKLQRARFFRTNAEGAIFAKAILVDATLEECICKNAIFNGADLRRTACARADFRGADLSSAKFSQSALGSIQFDDTTRVSGAVFTDATMSVGFRQYAVAAGATIGPGEGNYPIQVFERTCAMLRDRNKDGHLGAVLVYLSTLEKEVRRACGSLNWFEAVVDRFPQSVVQEVDECMCKSMEVL